MNSYQPMFWCMDEQTLLGRCSTYLTCFSEQAAQTSEPHFCQLVSSKDESAHCSFAGSSPSLGNRICVQRASVAVCLCLPAGSEGAHPAGKQEWRGAQPYSWCHHWSFCAWLWHSTVMRRSSKPVCSECVFLYYFAFSDNQSRLRILQNYRSLCSVVVRRCSTQ